MAVDSDRSDVVVARSLLRPLEGGSYVFSVSQADNSKAEQSNNTINVADFIKKKEKKAYLKVSFILKQIQIHHMEHYYNLIPIQTSLALLYIVCE